MARPPDPDALARLEEERDFLLRSIADLDREHEAGDVDPDDYQELRDGYVARAAAAARAITRHQDSVERAREAVPPRRARRVLGYVAVAAFATVAGVLLANALGTRGDDQITGQGAMPTSASDRCRTLSFRKPAEGVTCYDEVLADRPDDVDALTYRGWAKVRLGDVAGGTADFDRVVELDPEFPDVAVFRASVLKDAGDFAGAQAELDRLYSLNPSPLVISTMQQQGLDVAVANGLLADDVAACWTTEQSALAAINAATDVERSEDIDREGLVTALSDLAESINCLMAVTAARPDDVDALLLASLAKGLFGVVEPASVDAALADVDRALQVRPDDPTALLLRSVWRTRLGQLDGAEADLDALAERRVWPLVAPYVERSEVRTDIARQRSAATGGRSGADATTTTTG